MLIFDGDCPAASSLLDERNRDLTLPLDELRAQMRDAHPESIFVPYACLPEMRRGRIACVLMKIVARRVWPGSLLPGFHGAESVYAVGQGQRALYRALEHNDEAVILTLSSEISRHIERWEQEEDCSDLPVGFVLGLESADPIIEPSQVHAWWDDGVKVVSLTHYGPSMYAHGTGSEGGLKEPAAELLREMESCGMLLDMTHIADQSFWEAIELFSGPLLATHQNCRALAPGQRQFTDEQLNVIIERGGVIGASMDTWMLWEEEVIDWSDTAGFPRRDHFPREAVTLAHVANHIDHVCQLAGNSLHAAIGGDTDGQGGVDGAPLEIDSVADYQKLGPILESRGYSEEDIANIMYRNWQAFFEEHLPE